AVPLPGATVSFSAISGQPAVSLGTVSADGDVFARLAVGNRTAISVSVRTGNAEYGTGVFFHDPVENFTVENRPEALDTDGLPNDLGLHVLGRSGVPVVARLYLNDTYVKDVDSRGSGRLERPLDLLLSRPASRVGTLLGKFLGTFTAVAVPVTLVNLVGIAVLTAVSGKGPTGGFALAFLGLSLLLIAFYIPLQLIFSTLAKTSGTAILFGFLVWLAFNILYPVITFVLSAVLFPNSFQAQFQFSQVVGLGNPSSIYTQLVTFAAPELLRSCSVPGPR